MTVLGRITEMVAGRGTVEKCASHAYEDVHERRGTAKLLKSFTSAAPESTPVQLSVQCSVSSTITSSPATINSCKSTVSSNQTSIRPPLSRSHSESYAPTVWPYARSTTGAPDITARDLTPEELERAYCNDVPWDPKQQQPPPLSACRGFGRYRISVAADPDFQFENLQKNLGGELLETVEHLAELKLAGTDEAVWQRFVAEKSSRSNSVTSSRSSQSATGQSPSTEIDPLTGTRIVRGFTPSLCSSTSSSFKEGHTHYRKDSGFSTTSITRNASNHSHGRSQRQYSNRNGEATVSSPLSTIRELKKVSNQPHHKIAKPCEFGDAGDPDSALASDNETESWVDLHESKRTERRPSNCMKVSRNMKYTTAISKQSTVKPQITRNQNEQDETRRCNITARGLDRHKTVRATRPQFRRTQSRIRHEVPVKQTVVAGSPRQQGTMPPIELDLKNIATSQVVVKQDDLSEAFEVSDDVENSLVDLGLWMVDIGQERACETAPKARDDDSVSMRSNKSSDTMKQVRQQHETQRRRMRSGTAFRLSDDLQ